MWSSVTSGRIVLILACGVLAQSITPACTGDDFEGGASGTGGDDAGIDSGGAGGADSGAKNPIGSPCASSTSCASGYCVDGVCCESACEAACESCFRPGKNGQCTPFSAKQGAENECAPFVCNEGVCTSSCVADLDCASTAWCNSGSCEDLKANGKPCGGANQCESGLCEGGSCCAAACASPSSCESGQCSCGGAPCSAGATCIVWYLDQDGDGFAASSSNDKVGCSDITPAELNGKQYHATAADCFDQSANAFPGQTQFFSVHRGDGSYDYDCDSQETPKYKVVNSATSCTPCGQLKSDGVTCETCNAAGVSIYPGYGCGGCGKPINPVFKAPITCGATGTLHTCVGGFGCVMQDTTSTAPQSCR